MTCSVLNWQAEGYASNTFISLGANVVFDGGSEVDDTTSYIDLSGINDFEGLFTINDAEVTTFAEAPLIKNVHVRNGKVATKGGFIVQKEQKYFIIDSCSSTGDIASGGGGVSGYRSGANHGGQILILNSCSTGRIMGGGGGITGQDVGYNGGIVNITKCYSKGSIEGQAGGITGDGAVDKGGKLYVKQSYSTGDINARAGGGIVGALLGSNQGYVHIQECFSTGQISADNSGGICGSWAAHSGGEVHITDCYTRGDIEGNTAGGITGKHTGGFGGGAYVCITNTYASGSLKKADAGGIIGHIRSGFSGDTIHVQYSVYNQGKIVGKDDGTHLKDIGTSDDSSKIRGQLYHAGSVQRWEYDPWFITGTDTLPILLFQLPPPSASPSPTPSPTTSSAGTGSSTGTPSVTVTKTPTVTTSSTKTQTPTMSSSETSSSTGTPSATMTMTSTPTKTSTGTSSSTETSSPTLTKTSTVTSSSTETQTPTTSSSETSSSTGTPSATMTMTSTPTKTSTGTSSSTETSSPTLTKTSTATSSSTETQTPASSETSSSTGTSSATMTMTPSPTKTSIGTSSFTETPSPTLTKTSTVTSSSTETQTPTTSNTGTSSSTGTPSATMAMTPSPTRTSTGTSSFTETSSPTLTKTSRVTSSSTETQSPTSSSTGTPSITMTMTPSSTKTTTGTSSFTETSSPTMKKNPTETSSSTKTQTPTVASSPLTSKTAEQSTSTSSSGTSSSAGTPSTTMGNTSTVTTSSSASVRSPSTKASTSPDIPAPPTSTSATVFSFFSPSEIASLTPPATGTSTGSRSSTETQTPLRSTTRSTTITRSSATAVNTAASTFASPVSPTGTSLESSSEFSSSNSSSFASASSTRPATASATSSYSESADTSPSVSATISATVTPSPTVSSTSISSSSPSVSWMTLTLLKSESMAPSASASTTATPWFSHIPFSPSPSGFRTPKMTETSSSTVTSTDAHTPSLSKSSSTFQTPLSSFASTGSWTPTATRTNCTSTDVSGSIGTSSTSTASPLVASSSIPTPLFSSINSETACRTPKTAETPTSRSTLPSRSSGTSTPMTSWTASYTSSWTSTSMCTTTPSSTITQSGTASPLPPSSNSPTLFWSSTPWSSTLRTPTSTHTATPTNTPTRSSLRSSSPASLKPVIYHDLKSDESQSVMCTKEQPFKCVTLVYSQVIRGAFPEDGNGFEDAKLAVKSTDSEVTNVNTRSTCASRVFFDEDNHFVYSGCQEEYIGTELSFGLPIVLRKHLVQNETCKDEPEFTRCRQLTYALQWKFRPNSPTLMDAQIPLLRASADGEFRRLTGEAIVAIPLSIMIQVSSEDVAHINQRVLVDVSNALEDVQLETSLTPRTVFIDTGRRMTERSTSRVISRSVTLTVESNQRYSWKAASNIREIVTLPPSGISGNQPDSIQQRIYFDISRASPGNTQSSIEVSVSDIGFDLSKTMQVAISITVRVGNIESSTEKVRVEKSITGSAEARPITLSNYGNLDVQWVARLFDHKDEGLVEVGSQHLPTFWARPIDPSLLKGGVLPPQEQQQEVLEMEFDPRMLNGSGLFEAWLLFETDAVDGTVGLFSDEIPDILSERLFGKQIWVRLRLLATSVFICPSFPVEVELFPFGRVSIEWTVLNVDDHPLLVYTNKFSISFRSNSNSSTFEVSILDSLEDALQARERRFGNWLRLFPTSAIIPPRSQRILRAHLKYPQMRLSLSDSRYSVEASEHIANFQYKLSVFRWNQWLRDGVSSQSKDERDLSVIASFLPGRAVPVQSFPRPPLNRTVVGSKAFVGVVLADTFGVHNAKAIYRSEWRRRFSVDEYPTLRITVESLTPELDRSSIKMSFPRTVRRGKIVRGFTFSVLFQAKGKARLDIRLNNESVSGSPFALQTMSASCGENEVLNELGSQCLCQVGHYRIPAGENTTVSSCVQCEEGSFQPVPSNDGQCLLCPSEQFSTRGSERCYPCPGKGFECIQGKLLMRDGFWCELCSSARERQSTNETVRQVIFNKVLQQNPIQMLRCLPEQACLVNRSSFRTECKPGYEGPLCNSCDEGYVKTNGKCRACDGKSQSTILVALWAMLEFAIVTGLNLADLRTSSTEADADEGAPALRKNENEDDNTNVTDQLVEESVTNRRANSLTFTKLLVLLLIDYFQIGAIIGQLEYNPYASTMEWFEEATKIFLMDPTAPDSFRCLAGVGFFTRSLISLLFPWLLAVLSLGLYMLVAAARNRHAPQKQKTTWKDSLKPVVTVLGQIHSAVTMTVISVLDVYPHSIRGHKRLSSEMSFTTDQQEYSILVGIGVFTLITIVLGVPLLMIAYFLWRRRNATTPALRADFLDDIKGFRVRSSGFLWPAFVILRKVFLLVVVFFVAEAVNQVILVIIIFLIFQALGTCMHPYQRDSPLNFMEDVKSLALSVTMCFGLLRHTTTHDQVSASAVLGIQVLIGIASLISIVRLSPMLYREVVANLEIFKNAMRRQWRALVSALPFQRSESHTSSFPNIVQDFDVEIQQNQEAALDSRRSNTTTGRGVRHAPRSIYRPKHRGLHVPHLSQVHPGEQKPVSANVATTQHHSRAKRRQRPQQTRLRHGNAGYGLGSDGRAWAAKRRRGPPQTSLRHGDAGYSLRSDGGASLHQSKRLGPVYVPRNYDRR